MSIRNRFSTLLVKTKKVMPTATFIFGCVGIVAAGVHACRQTRKLDDVLKEPKKELEALRNGEESSDNRKATAKVAGKMAWALVKLYGPSVLLGAGSMACIATPYVAAKHTNKILSTELVGATTALSEYMARNKEVNGIKAHYNALVKPSEGSDMPDIVRENDHLIIKNGAPISSPYMFHFGKNTSDQYDISSDYNDAFIQKVIILANQHLLRHRHLFLNDVLKMLGMRPVPIGQHAGWIFSSDNKDGDNRVEIDILEFYVPVPDGPDRKEYWLSFNCDGDIIFRI